MSVLPSVCNAMWDLWFSRLLFKIDCWVFLVHIPKSFQLTTYFVRKFFGYATKDINIFLKSVMNFIIYHLLSLSFFLLFIRSITHFVRLQCSSIIFCASLLMGDLKIYLYNITYLCNWERIFLDSLSNLSVFCSTVSFIKAGPRT